MLKGKRFNKILAALIIGAVATTITVGVDAKRVHDPKVETKSEVRQVSSKNKTVNVNEDSESKSRIGSILRPAVTPHSILRPNADIGAILRPGGIGVEQPEFVEEPALDEPYTGYVYVPQTVSPYDTSIIGTPIASQSQCVRYLLTNNPNPRLPVSAEEIVAYYYEEGAREGIRPDVAFAQALKETGFFRYGGDVVPEQNNYCGLGTTGGGVRGEYFASPQMGVRAHIQHLLAYSSTRRPTTPIIDPRYSIVRNAYGDRTLGDWQDLNGRWAVPGNQYGQEILSMFKAILVQ